MLGLLLLGLIVGLFLPRLAMEVVEVMAVADIVSFILTDFLSTCCFCCFPSPLSIPQLQKGIFSL